MEESSEDGDGFTLKLNSFALVVLISSLLYFLMLPMISQKLSILHNRSKELDIVKMFIMSSWFACAVRGMSFAGLGALSIANIGVDYDVKWNNDDGDETSGDDVNVVDTNQDFYNKSCVVLFDLPDYIILSTYVLLILVWSECFISSRYHTLKNNTFRRTWLVTYMVFNSLLYGGQVVLYVLLFLPIDFNIQGLLFQVLTAINLFLVVGTFVLYLYMNCKFSGFPFKSEEAQERLRRLGGVLFYWTIGRVVWAVVLQLAEKYEINILSDSSLTSLILITVFIACELGPIFLSLDYGFINMMHLTMKMGGEGGGRGGVAYDIGVGFEGLSDDIEEDLLGSITESQDYANNRNVSSINDPRFSVHSTNNSVNYLN